MTVSDVVAINDTAQAYHIISTARSSKFFDAFYKVRDKVETFVDTRGIFSWTFKKRLREGGYKFDLLVDYQQAHGLARIVRTRYYDDEPLRIKKRDKLEINIPLYVVDILASFYYVRTQKLEVGMPLYMSNQDNRSVYDLQVIVQRKERVSVDAGKFNCIVVKPQLKGEGLFQQKGDLWVWLSDDQYKIPVQMKSKIAVGSITTELRVIEGVPLPLPAQVK